MLFHVTDTERGFAAKAGRGGSHQYKFSFLRGLMGFLFLVILLIGSFVAQSQHWEDGAKALLHMSEVVFGGLVGLIFGEKIAIDNVSK